MAVALAISRDDGSVTVFEGYRVQHNVSTGPSKGGIRFHQDVTIGKVAALSMWMSWKCSLVDLLYGGAKGGVIVNPTQLSPRELERLSRRYMQEMINFFGPQLDIPAPDLGTNEQIMGWMMDTYFTHVGHNEPGVVTGKPISLGGSQGRREATGAGVAYLIGKYLEDLKISISQSTVAIQGFGNVGSDAHVPWWVAERRSSRSPITPAPSTIPKASILKKPAPTFATRELWRITTSVNTSPMNSS
jgi:glutamate dehydrogenase (NAD(P)+)